MTARKHHHVSVFYLEGFTGPVEGYRRPMLQVIDCKDQRSFLASPRDVAFKKDFHRIDVVGHQPDALEKSFGDFEGRANEALKRIIATRSFHNTEDRECVFELMTTFSIKTPRHREGVRQFQEQIAKHILCLATATPERWKGELRRLKAAGAISDAGEDYERIREFAERGQFKVNMPTTVHLALELHSIDAVLECFRRRKWVLLRAPLGKTGFITSDEPLCLMWSDPARRDQFKGPGHGVHGTLVIFSLCNELALLGSFETAEGTRDLTDVQIAAVNSVVAEHANRQIYARDERFMYQFTHNDRVLYGHNFLSDQEKL